MSLFKKLWAVAFSGPKSGSATVQPEISNDELVTAYEWCAWPNDRLHESPPTALWWVTWLDAPEPVRATLRKLGGV